MVVSLARWRPRLGAFAAALALTTQGFAQPAPAPAAADVPPPPAAAPVPPAPPGAADAPPPAAAPAALPAPAPAPAPALQPSPFTGQPVAAQPYAPSAQPPPYAPAAPSAQPPPYASAAPPPVDTGSDTQEPPKRRKAIPLSGFRFGYGAYAGGSIDFRGQCAGSCPLSLRNGNEAVTETTRALLGYDLMFGPEPISLGFGFWFTTGTTLDSESDVLSERSIGWEFATPFMLGAVVPVADEIALRFGAFGGPDLLFADRRSAQGRDGEAYESLCDRLGSQIDECDVSSPTRFTWIYGFHAGPVFRVSSMNTIGAELLVQRMDVGLFDLDAEGPGWRGEQTYDYSAWKLWLVLTVGLGK
jgi:hypothetical protein